MNFSAWRPRTRGVTPTTVWTTVKMPLARQSRPKSGDADFGQKYFLTERSYRWCTALQRTTTNGVIRW